MKSSFIWQEILKIQTLPVKTLQEWLETVTKKNGEFIAVARGYINSVQDKETTEQYTSLTIQDQVHT